MTSFNIVDLITNNPITKLTETHNNNLLNKVKNTFNETEQQLFIASFYSYLNYHKTDDYIVDLDNIWKWLGFNKKYNATNCLEKYFKLDNDYKKTAPDASGAVLKEKKNGGQNIQKYHWYWTPQSGLNPEGGGSSLARADLWQKRFCDP